MVPSAKPSIIATDNFKNEVSSPFILSTHALVKVLNAWHTAWYTKGEQKKKK